MTHIKLKPELTPVSARQAGLSASVSSHRPGLVRFASLRTWLTSILVRWIAENVRELARRTVMPECGAAADDETAPVGEHCDALLRRQSWLRAPAAECAHDGLLGSRYAFAHALYRHVCYRRLGAAARAWLHRRVTATLLEGLRTRSLAVPAGELAVLATRLPWPEIEKALAPAFAHEDRKGRLVEGADLFGTTAQLAGSGVNQAGQPRLPMRLMAACFA